MTPPPVPLSDEVAVHTFRERICAAGDDANRLLDTYSTVSLLVTGDNGAEEWQATVTAVNCPGCGERHIVLLCNADEATSAYRYDPATRTLRPVR